MAKQEEQLKRLEVPYFDGVNTLVSDGISKKQELAHAENVRSSKIGLLEKRSGYRRLGDDISATANYGILNFKNETNGVKSFFRFSDVSSNISIYYMNATSNWTQISDASGQNLLDLGAADTRFDISDEGSDRFRYTYDGSGTDPNIETKVSVGDILNINAQNFNSNNNGTFTIIEVGDDYFDVENSSGVAENNKTIGTGRIFFTNKKFSHVIAEKKLFFVNGVENNKYLYSNTLTDPNTLGITESSDNAGNLYNSPNAHKINYFNDRLYIADYWIEDKRQKTSVMFSSLPLGIVALADGDQTVTTSMKVSETKYIYSTDTLDIYRGSVKVAVFTVTSKTETSINGSIVYEAGYTSILSSDEIWVQNTYGKNRIFRWASNPSNGVDVERYDTFKISANENERIKMLTTISNIQLIGTNNTMAIWNGNSVQDLDLNIGCVSDNGYVKKLGKLYFIHYTGIYSTNGSEFPRLESSKVQRYIDGATKAGLEGAVLGAKEYSIFAYIGDVTLYYEDGSIEKTLTDVVLELDVRKEIWFIHTEVNCNDFKTYISSSDADRLIFSSPDDGNLYELLYNTTFDDAVTSDKEIPMRIDLTPITLSKQFEKFSYPKEVIVESLQGSSIQCFISLDGARFYELKGSEASKGVKIFSVTPINEDVESARCKKIQISLREISGVRCKISRVAILYQESNEEEGQNT